MTAGSLTRYFVLLIFAVTLIFASCKGSSETIPDPNGVRPSVTGLSTNSADVGDQVIIYGVGFGTTQSGSQAKLNGLDFSIVEWTDTQITAQLVAGMSSGLVVVIVNGLSSQGGLETQLYVGEAPGSSPIINAVSPGYGIAGTSEVLVSGIGFGGDPAAGGVYFSGPGGVDVMGEVVVLDIGGNPVAQWTSSSIKVRVPLGAVTGTIHVMVNGINSNTKAFEILPPGSPTDGPIILGVDPLAGPIGTTVLISGANFGHSQGSSTATIGGVGLDIASWRDVEIIGNIPVGAVSGSIRITVGGVFVDSALFTVANPPEITGLAPEAMKIGKSVVIYGRDFGLEQGTGSLKIGNTKVNPNYWSNNRIEVDKLPSIDFNDPDAVEVVVTTDNGLTDSIFGKIGSDLTILVQVSPQAGEAGSTQFNFFVTVLGGTGNYDYTLTPDAAVPGETAPTSSSSPVSYVYPVSKVTAPKTFETRMKVEDKTTGDTNIVDGPSVFVVPQGTPVITEISVGDFNYVVANAPRNDFTYVWQPPTFTNELYHDFTFFGGDIIYGSGLSEVSDAGTPIPGITRNLKSFMSGGNNPRPFGYRYSPGSGDGKGSMVRISGINFTDVWGELYLNSDGIGDGYDNTLNIANWTDTAVDFYMPDNVNLDLAGNVVISVNGEAVKSAQKLICSPYITNVLPDPVSQSGLLTFTGFDLIPPTMPGVIGTETYLIWVAQATYNDPFGGGTKTGPALVTNPYPATPIGNLIQFDMSDLGTGGLVEVLNPLGDQAQFVNATFTTGTYQAFIWSGALTTETNLIAAQSGIFSQAFTVEVGGGGGNTWSVSGNVTEADPPNDPVSGITLTLTPGGFSATTGASGNFSILNVPDGNYTLTPSGGTGDFTPASMAVNVAGGNQTGKNFVMNTGGGPGTFNIGGLAYDGMSPGNPEDNPMAGCQVQLIPIAGGAGYSSNVTGADGRWTINNVNGGDYIVICSNVSAPPGYNFGPAPSNPEPWTVNSNKTDWLIVGLTLTP